MGPIGRRIKRPSIRVLASYLLAVEPEHGSRFAVSRVPHVKVSALRTS